MTEEEYPYKVSASIITYNQADYIQKAVDSAIAQEVDFPYEIIIGDDYSTDGTREILLDYKERYPDLIRLNLHEKHGEGIAGRENNMANIESARGRYIAFLDGDDYWISEDKLQKQADFLDHHPDYSFCFHDAFFRNEDVDVEFYMSDKFYSLRKSDTFTFKDFITEKVEIPTCSTLVRSRLLQPLPDWFRDVYLADRFLQLIAGRHGPFRYMKELKSARILNTESVSNHFFSEDMLEKIKKNDYAVMKSEFDESPGRPINYKAQLHMEEAMVDYYHKRYVKCTKECCRAVREDWRIIGLYWREKMSRRRFKQIKNADKGNN
jgi:glycosyltransferase involved in cell wall biosynthesis